MTLWQVGLVMQLQRLAKEGAHVVAFYKEPLFDGRGTPVQGDSMCRASKSSQEEPTFTGSTTFTWKMAQARSRPGFGWFICSEFACVRFLGPQIGLVLRIQRLATEGIEEGTAQRGLRIFT